MSGLAPARQVINNCHEYIKSHCVSNGTYASGGWCLGESLSRVGRLTMPPEGNSPAVHYGSQVTRTKCTPPAAHMVAEEARAGAAESPERKIGSCPAPRATAYITFCRQMRQRASLLRPTKEKRSSLTQGWQFKTAEPGPFGAKDSSQAGSSTLCSRRPKKRQVGSQRMCVCPAFSPPPPPACDLCV